MQGQEDREKSMFICIILYNANIHILLSTDKATMYNICYTYLQYIFPLQIHGVNAQNKFKAAVFEAHVVRVGNLQARRIP